MVLLMVIAHVVSVTRAIDKLMGISAPLSLLMIKWAMGRDELQDGYRAAQNSAATIVACGPDSFMNAPVFFINDFA